MKLINIISSLLLAIFISACVPSNIEPKTDIVTSQKIDIYAVYQDGCPACTMMKTSMRDPRVQSLLSSEFTVHTYDIRDKESLPKVWMRPVYTPTLYFLDRNQKELISSINAQTADQLLLTLNSAIEARDLK